MATPERTESTTTHTPLPPAPLPSDPRPPFPGAEIVGAMYCRHGTYAPNGVDGFGFHCIQCSIEEENERLGFTGRLARTLRDVGTIIKGTTRLAFFVTSIILGPFLVVALIGAVVAGVVVLIMWLTGALAD